MQCFIFSINYSLVDNFFSQFLKNQLAFEFKVLYIVFFQECGICAYKHLVLFSTIEVCPLVSFGYPTIRHNSEHNSNLVIFPFSTYVGHPQIRVCFKFGLKSLHNSVGVLGADIVGTLFSRYIVVSKAYPPKEEGKED